MAPVNFRRSQPKTSLDGLDQSSNTDGSGPLAVWPTSEQLTDGAAGGTMKRIALSMLELNEVREIRDFGNVLEAIERQVEVPGAQDGAADVAAGYADGGPTAGRDDQDDFLLIESSDRSDSMNEEALDTMGGFIMRPSDNSSGTMRRCTSMVSFHSSDKQNLCLSSIMALPQIEIAHETHHRSNRNNKVLGGCAVDVKSRDGDKESQRGGPCGAHDMDKPCLGSSLTGCHASFIDLDQSNTSARTNGHATSLNTFRRKDCSRVRNVSFSSLEIRSYNLTLGDAPTSKGPAISLDWEYDPQSAIFQIDDYENERISTRRSKHEMFMPPAHRQYLLMREAGFSRGDIQRAVDQAKKIAKERERTRRNLALQPVEEVLETAKRRFGRLVKRKS